MFDRFRRPREPRSLVTLARMQAREAGLNTWRQWISSVGIACALPTRPALIVTLVATAVALAVVVTISIYAKPLDQTSFDGNALLVLWQVQAGIAAIALPLLLFVIETARDDPSIGGARTHEVLLRRTLLFPILNGALAATAIIGAGLIFRPSGALRFPFALLLLGTVIATLYAFFRALELSFSRVLLRAATLNVLREKMRLSVNDSVVQRLARNAFVQKADELGLKHNPFGPSSHEESDYTTVTVRRSGVIADIDLFRIRRMMRMLEASRIGPAASRQGAGIITLGLQDVPSEPPYWMRIIGDGVKADRTDILTFKAADYADVNLDALRREADRALTIDAADRTPTLEGELGYLRDVMIDSIRQGRTRHVEDHLELYETLVREFLETLKRWGASYDIVSARREDTALIGGQWSELEWVERDLYEFGTIALDQKDFSMIREIIGTAYGLALYAVGSKEFYVYKHALQMIVSFYRAANHPVRAVDPHEVAERIAFILRELGQLKVSPAIDHAATPEDIQFGSECGKTLIATLSILTRYGMDGDRAEDVRAFHNASARAFRFLQDRSIRQASHRDDADNNPLVGGRREAAERLDRERRIANLGLALWTLRQYASRRFAPERAREYISLFTDDIESIPHLWELVIGAIDMQAREVYDWSGWVLFDHRDDDRIVHIDVHDYLWRLFVLLALKRMADTPEPLTLTASNTGRGAAYGDSAAFWRAFKEITEAEPDSPLRTLFDAPPPDSATRLSAAVRAMVAAQEQHEIDALVDKEIDSEKVREVADDVRKSFTRDAILRRLHRGAHAWAFAQQRPSTVEHLGYFRLDNKDVFVNEPTAIALSWGDNYGRGLAFAETREVVNAMLQHAAVADEPGEWTEVLRATVRRMTATNRSLVVLLFGDGRHAWHLSTAEGFVRATHNKEAAGALGRFEGADVYELYMHGTSAVVVVDLRRFGLWQQYAADRKFENAYQYDLGDGLMFELGAITEATAEKILNEQPDLVANLGGPDRSREEAVRQLRRSVRIRIVEAFEYTVKDPTAARQIPIPTEQQA